MKKVEAIIKPFKLDAVKEALSSVGVQGMTVTEVKGFGRQKGHTEILRGADRQGGLSAQDQDRNGRPRGAGGPSHREAYRGCSTDSIGDGKIFVMPVKAVIRIRTGETDKEAL